MIGNLKSKSCFFIRTFLGKSQFSSRHLLPNMFCSNETLTLFQLCGILPSFVSHDASSGRVEGEKQLRPRPLVGSAVAEVNSWTSRLGRESYIGNCCDWWRGPHIIPYGWTRQWNTEVKNRQVCNIIKWRSSRRKLANHLFAVTLGKGGGEA